MPSQPARPRSVAGGALCAETGVHTGRSPKDKHTVVDALTENTVWWDGNRKMTPGAISTMLYDDFHRACQRQDSCSRRTSTAAPIRNTGSRPASITELAWHSLFIRQLLIRPERAELASFVPELTIVDLPSFKADRQAPRRCEGSDTMIAIDFTRKIILIGGSSYAGEIKKSVFTTLNFYLPARGRDADALLGQCRARTATSALFFGLSGTGKTTLSADPQPHADRRRRARLGPGRHLQFRGRLLRQVHQALAEAEPEIWDATNRFGAVLENVVFDPETRIPRLRRRARRPRTRARPIRSTSSRMPRAPAAPATRRTSSS